MKSVISVIVVSLVLQATNDEWHGTQGDNSSSGHVVAAESLGDEDCQNRAKPETGAGVDLTVWPNAVSKANSDPWLMENHDEIRKMRPRVLVLNFCNGFNRDKAERMAKQLIGAIAESTRYHGYADKDSPPFIVSFRRVCKTLRAAG